MTARSRGVLACALFVLIGARGLAAQELRGTVRDSASLQPVAGAVLVLLDAGGGVVGRNITNERGQYRVALTRDMRWLRVLRIGFRPKELGIPEPGAGVTQLDVVMTSLPTFLETVRVSAASNCPKRSNAAEALALLEQARAGLLATVVAREANPASMTRMVFERWMDGTSDKISHQKVHIEARGRVTSSFNAVRSGTEFVIQGFTADSGGSRTFFGPDAEVLLDDGFARGYCFRIADADRARPREIGLGFTAADRRDGRVDIDGILWVDTVARALRNIEFRYVGLERRIELYRPGGRISFREMPNGVVLVDQWVLRLVGAEQDTVDGKVVASEHPRLYANESGGEVAHATWPDGSAWSAPLGTLRVHAVTHDSLPAAGTVVRLADTDYQATADAGGNFEISDLIPGPYSLIVLDPTLAAVGVTLATPLRFVAARDSTERRTLEVPTAEDYVAHSCETAHAIRGTAWLLARVTTPDGMPVDKARWTLAKLSGSAWVPVAEHGETGTNGLLSWCNDLPRFTTVKIEVRRPGEQPTAVTRALSEKLTILTIQLPYPR